MGGPDKKRKFGEGEATKYISRRKAVIKLRLNLKDFRRLCILKGVHPREPNNRRKAQKGCSIPKTLYMQKDIRFLLHEPIVWKFRDQNAFMKKWKKAVANRDNQKLDIMERNKIQYTLDHIVRERYPTFIDAIRDLEDCLCLTFLFSTFPGSSKAPIDMINLCRRLCVEFNHYVIEARALRKVFCSIKGYYFQADIKGQKVTWIVPHNFGWNACDMTEVDVKIMSVFTEFYTTMLGFINFRLYNQLNLTYPPKLQGVTDLKKDEEMEHVSALNQSLHRTIIQEEVSTLDKIEDFENDAAIDAARKEADSVESLVKLFNGLKFFLGREVPRDPLVFMIRSLGGEVSWDPTVQSGSTFKVDDERITHHIADRELISDKKLGRFYVQPQWVFDSINMRKKLNEKDYALGETLPPHLSPFIEENKRDGDYVTPDEAKMQKALLSRDQPEQEAEKEDAGEEEDSEEEEGESGDESVDEEDVGEGESDGEAEVKVGQKEMVDKQKVMSDQEREEWKLREMMIKKKDKNLYRNMMKGRKYRQNEARKLTKKREEWEEENTPPAKKPKKKVIVADE